MITSTNEKNWERYKLHSTSKFVWLLFMIALPSSNLFFAYDCRSLLRAHGFKAQVLQLPNGMIGDMALFVLFDIMTVVSRISVVSMIIWCQLWVLITMEMYKCILLCMVTLSLYPHILSASVFKSRAEQKIVNIRPQVQKMWAQILSVVNLFQVLRCWNINYSILLSVVCSLLA
jgi:hypothetical protein